MHARAKVKVGDRVTKGQVLADTNYVKDGELAMGKNLLVAYTPYKGLNVEDGVVISTSAARKMTSEHLYQQPYLYDAEGAQAAIIGMIEARRPQVLMVTELGGERVLDELEDDPLPRIC